jgi:hypothetical protein
MEGWGGIEGIGNKDLMMFERRKWVTNEGNLEGRKRGKQSKARNGKHNGKWRHGKAKKRKERKANQKF